MTKLFLVSTPIGNLKDITQRVQEVLSRVDLVACEDTRHTGLLLKKLGFSPRPRLVSYYEENEDRRLPFLLRSLKNGQNVALVTNAGTPLLSDPGFKLVRAAIQAEICVVPVPGPSAALAALVASGLPTDKFLFLGFLPKKAGKRQKLLTSLLSMPKSLKATTIIYVSPHRLRKILADIQTIFGDLEIVIARELTKLHEEIRREKISESIVHFTQTPPRGEFTLVFSPTQLEIL